MTLWKIFAFYFHFLSSKLCIIFVLHIFFWINHCSFIQHISRIFIRNSTYYELVSQAALAVKNMLADARDIRDTNSIPGSGRSLGGGHGNPLQNSCLEKPMDRGTWWVIVYSVTLRHNWSNLACSMQEKTAYLGDVSHDPKSLIYELVIDRECCVCCDS